MDFTSDQREKIKNFKWVDDEQEGTEDQPGIAIAEDAVECAKAVITYVLENIKASHYDNGRFVIPIPLKTHRLLQERYNSAWTDESRVKIFEIIRGVFGLTVESEKEVLEDRINEIAMPTKASEETMTMLRKYASEHGLDQSRIGEAPGQYKVKWTKLYDEPTVVSGEAVDQEQIVVEIDTDGLK